MVDVDPSIDVDLTEIFLVDLDIELDLNALPGADVDIELAGEFNLADVGTMGSILDLDNLRFDNFPDSPLHEKQLLK